MDRRTGEMNLIDRRPAELCPIRISGTTSLAVGSVSQTRQRPNALFLFRSAVVNAGGVLILKHHPTDGRYSKFDPDQIESLESQSESQIERIFPDDSAPAAAP